MNTSSTDVDDAVVVFEWNSFFTGAGAKSLWSLLLLLFLSLLMPNRTKSERPEDVEESLLFVSAAAAAAAVDIGSLIFL